MTGAREMLNEATLTRREVDRFLDSETNNWAVHDPELGYRIRDNVLRVGLDESYTITRFAPTGERRMVNFADQPCRINTYGNSFTQCHQVSDGESWQEYLAAHLGEPIRNFGISGQSVYQAYRRIRTVEKTALSAEYLVLNIYSDDHFRNVYGWRVLRRPGAAGRLRAEPPVHEQAWRFAGVPSPYLRLELDTGTFREEDNPYPTPQSLYLLCDTEHVYEAFKDDLGLHMTLARQGSADADVAMLRRAADALGVAVDFGSNETAAEAATALLETCALRSTTYILDRLQEYARESGKKLLVLLSFTEEEVLRACRGQPRFDRPFVDYLKERSLPFVDILEGHLEEFGLFRLTPEEYIRRYFIGHYNPRGNHFFAFAVKDSVVEWLDPKPPAYREWALAEQL